MTCKQCGKIVPATRKGKSGGIRFCSHSCFLASKRKRGQDRSGTKIQSTPVGTIPMSICLMCDFRFTGVGDICPYCATAKKRAGESLQVVRHVPVIQSGRADIPVFIEGGQATTGIEDVPEGECVYRAYGDSGELLYVGISKDFPFRAYSHSKGSKWYGYCRFFYLEFYETRAESVEAERRAIRNENPICNVAHSDRIIYAEGGAYIR